MEKNKLIATLFMLGFLSFQKKKKTHLWSYMLINHYLLNYLPQVLLAVLRCFLFFFNLGKDLPLVPLWWGFYGVESLVLAF